MTSPNTLATRFKGALLAVLVMGPFLAQADATIANVATPAIRTGLAASESAIELVVSAYLIAFAVLIIPGARLGNTHGYKRMFLLGVALFGVTSLLCGLAPNAPVLVLTRALQGAAGALMFPQALTGIQLNFTAENRARAIGYYTVALSCGAVLGQILGGVLIEADLAGTGWRSIFLVNVPVCAIVLVAGLRYLPSDQRRTTSAGVHPPSVVALAVAVLLLVLPLCLGRTEGWPLWTWLSLIAAAPAAWLFLTVMRRAEALGASPLFSVDALRRRPIVLGLAGLFTATSTYYALLFTLAQYVQFGLGHSAVESGLMLVTWVAAFGVAGKVAARLPVSMHRQLPWLGCVLLASAFLGVSGALFVGWHPMALLVVLLTVGGFGLGTQFSTMIGHLTRAVEDRYASDISGASTMTMQMGGATGVALFGTLYLALAPMAGVEAAAHHAFALDTLLLGCAALLAGTFAWCATHLE
ncbi:MFS transporter [Pseudonocardia spinosispora]|uniref:MFS transporter n=1 Tax=Pseudonocardia spinosispora TaxID=103441 RepID=UPI00040D9689|nr:MFS transporter [Pseudonocardia spinosispora]